MGPCDEEQLDEATIGRILELEKKYLSWRFSDTNKERILVLSEPVHHSAIPLSTALASLSTKKRVVSDCMRHFGDVSVRDKFMNSPLSHADSIRCTVLLKSLFDRGIKNEDLFLVYTRLPRFMMFNHRKKKDAFLEFATNHVIEVIQWYKSSYFPISDKEVELRKALDAGIAYWKGRDRFHRPILVLRPTSKTMCPTAFERLIIFLFEWARQFLFVPGVSETAIIWFDVTEIPLTKVPYGDIQSIIAKLTIRYPFHLDNIYLIHDSIWIQTITPVVRTFMTELQKLKIRIYRKRIPVDELHRFEECVVESRYGGKRAQITKYYPFPLYTSEFSDPAVLDVWDAKCLEGMPHIIKEIRIPINTGPVKALLQRMSDLGVVEEHEEFSKLLVDHVALLRKDREIYAETYYGIPFVRGMVKVAGSHVDAHKLMKRSLTNGRELASIESDDNEKEVLASSQGGKRSERPFVRTIELDSKAPATTHLSSTPVLNGHRRESVLSSSPFFCPLPILACQKYNALRRYTNAECSAMWFRDVSGDTTDEEEDTC